MIKKPHHETKSILLFCVILIVIINVYIFLGSRTNIPFSSDQINFESHESFADTYEAYDNETTSEENVELDVFNFTAWKVTQEERRSTLIQAIYNFMFYFKYCFYLKWRTQWVQKLSKS